MNKEKIRLLVLDDSEEFIFLLTSLLSFHDIEFETESNPFKALDLVRTEKFDLIITDYMMDVMDGITFSKKIREIKGNSKTKIILLTAKHLEDDELYEVRKTELVYVNKPISPNDLHKKIMDTIRDKNEKME